MAKSKRSKVKLAYKAMRRRIMEPKHDQLLRKQAEKVYTCIGLEMPPERDQEDVMPERKHGGSYLVSTFHPTEPGPKLNVVHGPLANKDPLLQMETPVVGFPSVGAGVQARLEAEHPNPEETCDDSMQVSARADDQKASEKPYFYPRRAKKEHIERRLRERKSRRHPKNGRGVQFI